jgi:hypothetical protein
MIPNPLYLIQSFNNNEKAQSFLNEMAERGYEPVAMTDTNSYITLLLRKTLKENLNARNEK